MRTADFRTHLKRFVVPPATHIQRRPTDLIYLIIGTVVLVTTSLILFATRGHFENIDFNLFRLINALPDSLARVVWALMQAGSLAAVPVIVLLALLAGRIFLARNLFVGGMAAWILNKVVKLLVVRGRPGDILEEVIIRGGVAEGLGFPSGHVTVATTLATIASPYLGRRLNWLSWALVGVVSLGRIYVGAHFPIDVIGGLALGVMIGALVNLLLGVPHEDHSRPLIREAFLAYGLTPAEISPVSDDARGSVPFFVRTEDGGEYFVKLLGTEHRNADFLFKVWRALLLKNVVNTAPFLTPKQQAEHEAYLSLLAQAHQVRTPEIEFATRVGENYALLAQKRVRGQTLAELEKAGQTIDETTLSKIWEQVRRLHEARIAHGDLRQANLFIDEAGEPWLIDFGFADGGADPAELAQDRAQILASLAKVAGPEATVRTALAVLGPEAVCDAVPTLQPMALSSATRADMKEEPDLLDSLRAAVVEQTGQEIEEERSVFRVDPKSAFWLLGLGIGVYLLFPQLGELGLVVESWEHANPLWLIAALAIFPLTYIMATISQIGALKERLPFWQSVMAHSAASFANRFGPRGVGGMVVLEQYLENRGIERRQAVTSIAVKTAASVLVYLLLSFLAVSWLGVENVAFLDQIEGWQIGIALALLLGAALYFLRSPERAQSLLHSAKQSLRDLMAILKEPRKALELFGGALGTTLAYVATFVFSMWAVGVEISPVNVATVYLAGEVISSASPTPGGLGVLEGTLVAGLKAFGVSSEQAVAGVLLYRFITFWLPILPGFLLFRYLQKEDAL